MVIANEEMTVNEEMVVNEEMAVNEEVARTEEATNNNDNDITMVTSSDQGQDPVPDSAPDPAAKEKVREIIHGFDVTGFYDFLYGLGYNMVEDEKDYELVDRIVRYGFEREMVFKDQFCEWLAKMIPGVNILDAASFMARGRLSDELIEALENDNGNGNYGNKVTKSKEEVAA